MQTFALDDDGLLDCARRIMDENCYRSRSQVTAERRCERHLRVLKFALAERGAGRQFPSYADICEHMGWTAKTTARGALERLRAGGLIEGRMGQNGRWVWSLAVPTGIEPVFPD